MTIKFYKYQGTGNDFIMIDNRQNQYEAILDDDELIKRLCDRRFGIGADGMIALNSDPDYDFRMIYFNADGNEGTMCGNGGRALVAFAHDLNIIDDETTFIATDGEHKATINEGVINLRMMDVSDFDIEVGKDYYYLDTGSPHYVVSVKNEQLELFDVFTEGRKIRYSERFWDEGTNVNFVEKLDSNQLFVRTYERGVEDETLSCGTGVTACAISAVLAGDSGPIEVETKGGTLTVHLERKGDSFINVYLSGPAKYVFKGAIEV